MCKGISQKEKWFGCEAKFRASGSLPEQAEQLEIEETHLKRLTSVLWNGLDIVFIFLIKYRKRSFLI